MYRVFLSYSTKDLNVAETAGRILSSASIDVFMAERSVSAGDPLTERIKQAITDSDLFLVLWSKNSTESDWVRHEVGAADGQDKVILPVLLDRNAELPPPIRHLKYHKAFEDPENAFTSIRDNVFARAEQKQQRDGLIWLGLGLAFVYFASRK